MLKALELSGFKSFADRTRLEFPRGISVVVGPNGSGKSNIVDAVKWVLGSQSAKSLRGKEMTDVIFNGCPTRTPLGTAEVTLTLDNDDGRLGLDSKEVHVTRRVYRSGEGEYLLNRQPCRLREIRDLLAGTGITTEAYCIIEQGKVDALLQSSPRDRRVIFEEAAGISQFKAKKATAQRRLERVEQNLLRLSDIVDEVESRLRSVRSQAGKARRYRESAERLRQLRTELGMVDWREQTQQIAAREAQLADIRRRADEHARRLEQCEFEVEDLERRLDTGTAVLRELETAATAAREQIAARQAVLENQHRRQADLQEETARIRRQLVSMTSSADGIDHQFRVTMDGLQSADADLATASAQCQDAQQRAGQSQHEVDQARRHLDAVTAKLSENQHFVSSHTDQLTVLESQLASARTGQEQNRKRQADLAAQLDARQTQTQRLVEEESQLRVQSELHQRELRSAEERLAHVRQELARADKHQRQLEAQLTRCRERIAVLTELEQRLEGLDGGIQEVLRTAREIPGGPLGEVCGVVADLFRVDVDSAHLIEAALGERAQFVVVASASRLFAQLEREPLGIAGRIGFLRLDTRAAPSVLDHVDLSAETGVMGRADQFIETAPEYVPLVRRLLGRTWLVDRLATALRLSQSAGRGLEFVTSDGELLTADGTLILGPRLLAAGIMSRRSELRACHEQVTELEQQLTQHAAIYARLEHQRTQHESIVGSSIAAYTTLTEKLAESRQHTAASHAHLESLVRESQQIEGELHVVEERIAALGRDKESAAREQTIRQLAVTNLQAEIDSGGRRLAHFESQLVQARQEVVDRQVVRAKCEQRVEILRQQVELAQRNRQGRERMLAETRQRLAAQQAQLTELDECLLADRQFLAEMFLHKEQLARELTQHAQAEQSLRSERLQNTEKVRHLRQQLATISAQQHKLEVAVNRLHHERQTLCERMQDDYGIDLAEVAKSAEHGARSEENQPGTDPKHPAPRSSALAPLDRQAAEREITQLRDQINNMGAVNLEALDELENLESRFGTLSGQYRDLVEAKTSLERIIQRINADSRQLFLMTVDTVRGHFQELFRRLFGGGEANIVVDEGEDVLECGIEIVARPPGKEACSISLLSGGEKTLTCVALLLAVFRSKPSPFCVLDEVDAALDEANIGRFISVLREFLSFTQFVVISHSKKTMSGADTLYGVTMEESGVSKRVSVRFEDVSEDGHIRTATLRSREETNGSIASVPEVNSAERRAA
jgi:chromosome segregation protein